MKSFAQSCVILALLGCAATGNANVLKDVKAHVSRQGAMDNIVGILKEMLEQSARDGKADDEAYAKFKCYCDSNLKDKEAAIKGQTEQVDQLGGVIQQLSGTAGQLSMEMNQIETTKGSINEAKAESTNLRESEAKEYAETTQELDAALAAMDQAIAILADIGSDSSTQTVGFAAVNTKVHKAQFLAPSEAAVAKLKTSLSQALTAASAFLKPEDKAKVAAFLQQEPRADFRGAYETQSGGILGVLRNMKETFEQEKTTARENEASAVEEHEAFIKAKDESFVALGDSLAQKQDLLGLTDTELSAKKSQFDQASVLLTDDENYLNNLEPMCAQKAKEYDYRKSFRVGEEVAVTKAIFILQNENSQKKLARQSFLQIDAKSALKEKDTGSALQKVWVSLDEQAHRLKSQRLARVAGLIEVSKDLNPFREGYGEQKWSNPYDIIFEEMAKMIKVMEQEAAVDKQQLDWCQHERTTNEAAIVEKQAEVSDFNTTVLNLLAVIEDAESGLKAQITIAEDSVEQVRLQQREQSAIREEEFAAFKAKVRDIEEELPVLKSAIEVLENYYNGAPVLNATLVQQRTSMHQNPEMPATWEEAELSKSTQGTTVVGMLQQIYDATAQELATAKADEDAAADAYRLSMKEMKRTEDEQMVALANLQMQKAVKDEELEAARDEVHMSQKDKMSMEQYLKAIKPGCDFINQNFEMRETNRATEKKAMNTAKEQIMASPAYQQALEDERLGKCKDICQATSGEAFEHVNCQACLNDVTKVGWCVSHPFTTGCFPVESSTASA